MVSLVNSVSISRCLSFLQKKNLKKKRLFWLATFLFPHSLDLKNSVIMKSKRKKNNQTKQKKLKPNKQTNKKIGFPFASSPSTVEAGSKNEIFRNSFQVDKKNSLIKINDKRKMIVIIITANGTDLHRLFEVAAKTNQQTA